MASNSNMQADIAIPNDSNTFTVTRGYVKNDSRVGINTNAINAALKLKGISNGSDSMSPAQIASAIESITTSITVNNIAGNISYGYHWHDTASTNKVVFDEKQGTVDSRKSSVQGCWNKVIIHHHTDGSITGSSDACHTRYNGTRREGCGGHYICTGVYEDKGFYGYKTYTCDTCGATTSASLDCGDVMGCDRGHDVNVWAQTCPLHDGDINHVELGCGWQQNQIAEARVVFPSA